MYYTCPVTNFTFLKVSGLFSGTEETVKYLISNLQKIFQQLFIEKNMHYILFNADWMYYKPKHSLNSTFACIKSYLSSRI